MEEKLTTLLCEAGSFITFLGPKMPGTVHTVPSGIEPTKLEKPLVSPDECVIECFGKWTKFRRRQFGGATYEEAIDKALQEYEAGMSFIDGSGSHPFEDDSCSGGSSTSIDSDNGDPNM